MNINNKKMPLVVIFGRTNVGKSTLFNCLIEKQQALVSKIEGTTRDSNIGQVSWQGKTFELVDTGGIIDLKYLIGTKNNAEDIEAKVQQQARDYLQQADLILFLVDNKAGLLPQDKQMALLLKKMLPDKFPPLTKGRCSPASPKLQRGEKGGGVLLIANKVDSIKQRPKIAEFHKLSLGEPIPISAATGSGTGDMLDIVVKKIKTKKEPKLTPSTQHPTPNIINVCIIGKPNVGKSSLLNSILGKACPEHGRIERVIVSPVPHTTREPQDTEITYKNQIIKLIDTAGISRKGAKTKGLEKYGIIKSLAALKKSDIALLVLDINENITHQDAKLIEEIVKRKKSLIFIANKWDLIKERNTKEYTNYIYGKLPFAQFAPIQFTSALTGEKVKKVLDLALDINQQRQLQLSNSQLSHFLNRIVKLHKPAKGKGTKHPRIYELKQIKINPPKFEIRIGAKDNLHFSYVRFIENRLREKYGFLGTPLTIKITKGQVVHGEHNK